MIHQKYKNKKVFLAAHSVSTHPNLLELELWIQERYGERVCTSAFRSAPIHAKDSSIHRTDPLRAKDYRSRDMSDPELIADDINEHWEYDPRRPGKYKVCKYHDTGQGWHFHIQVHSNTRLGKP
jgi:hypothetical protein|tara:strand:+ start:115 stop:486 length:372 start_codon:yes stop_codon:yes gene_type:complete